MAGALPLIRGRLPGMRADLELPDGSGRKLSQKQGERPPKNGDGDGHVSIRQDATDPRLPTREEAAIENTRRQSTPAMPRRPSLGLSCMGGRACRRAAAHPLRRVSP